MAFPIAIACLLLGLAGVPAGNASTLLAQTAPPVSQSSPAPNANSLGEAWALIKRQQYSLAEQRLRSYLKLHPESAQAHFMLGYVLYREQRPKDSLEQYTAGARIEKPHANDLAAVAMDYILLRDYSDADKWLTLAVKWDPGNFLYVYYLGRTKYNEGQYQQAVTTFTQALSIRPESVRSEYNLGLSYAALNRTDDAVAAYKKAIELEKEGGRSDPQPYYDLGHLMLEHQDYQQAAVNLEKAVLLDPKNPRFHQFLGQAYEFLGKLGMAATQMEEAIKISPDVSALHFQLGRIYQKQGLRDEARQEFARCSALQGSHSTDGAQTPNPPGRR
jgi:tetratricopeptide (TPR) repeat protein